VSESSWPDAADGLALRILDTPQARETVLYQAKAVMASLITLTEKTEERTTPEVGECMASAIVVAFEKRFGEHFAWVGSIYRKHSTDDDPRVLA
jgi:hypothetical protein